MSRECRHGYKTRHADHEWYVYCPGGSRWWNLVHRIANRLPGNRNSRLRGAVIYKYEKEDR